MNKAESNHLENELKEYGWLEASVPEEADLVILNTCSVRTTAENRIWGRLGYFKHLKNRRQHTLVLMGCMAERLKDEIRRKVPTVDIVVGNFQKDSFFATLSRISTKAASFDLAEAREYSFAENHGKAKEFKSFVPIMHGCDNFCSYCIVPYVRGREVSRDPRSILEEIQSHLSRGVKEITLLGQNVNSYKFTMGNRSLTFPSLLKQIAEKVPNLPWLRFLTSHPKDFSPELIECLADIPELCKHVHLPLQHGSNRILTAMNRKYSREDYISLVDSLRSRIPQVSLCTDILIGFPGETEQDFQDTLDILMKLEYDDAYTYYYNPIEGTQAYSLPEPVPEKIKLERLEKIIRVQREISQKKKVKKIGTVEKVLIEEISKKTENEVLARTEHDDMVIVSGTRENLGNFKNVKLLSLKGNTFLAEEVA